MTDMLLVLAGVLIAVTVGASIEYYRQLRKVQKEFEKAKHVVGDIVLSFNRELRRETEKLEIVANKVQTISWKSDKALESAHDVKNHLHNLEPKIVAALEDREKTLPRLDEIERNLRDIVSSHRTLSAKISDIERQGQQFSMVSEQKVNAVIPLKREKALAHMTETELSVVQILALEGPKTAPQIKERIALSREHTARLMKKLYEAGYVDRDTDKTPFKYHVKKEMANLLKGTESRI